MSHLKNKQKMIFITFEYESIFKMTNKYIFELYARANVHINIQSYKATVRYRIVAIIDSRFDQSSTQFSIN